MNVSAFYERSVNGRGVSTLHALAGVAPRFRACACAPLEPRGEALSIPLQTGAPAIPLPKLNAGRLAPVLHVLVHGSQATSDACEFSDIDVLIVVEDRRAFSAREHEDAARELRMLLRAVYRYDPLMHHGLMFCGAGRFDAYDESFLPLETLRLARSIYGRERLAVYRTKPDLGAMRHRVRAALDVLNARLAEHTYERGDFAYKQFLSNVLLLPALVAAARGEFVYKRESFALARSWFTPRQWSGIRRAEEYRARWKRPPEPAMQALLGERSHPCLRARWAAQQQHRYNAGRLAPAERETWTDELRRTFARAEELAA